MADRLEVDMIVNAISQGFEKISSDFQQSGDAVKKAGDEAKSSGMKWTEMKSQIDLASAAASKFVEVGQEIFQFGREGAMFAQTTQSFDGLIDKLGITTPLMDNMRSATMGTVDDMTLMSSALTLVAGTSDEMGRKLMDATPQLAQIAKAANKLNPSLGDTAFLMESLGLGIKRASPMILDNLGLTIKLGAANEAMAEKLGKSVAALTAEEKQMALLNATIAAGDKLIEQAGGTVESAVDDYDRLTATWTNLTNHIKAEATPAIGAVVKQIYNMIAGWEDFKNTVNAEETLEIETWEDYKQAIMDAAEETGRMTGTVGRYQKQAIEAATHTITLADGVTILGEKEFYLNQAMMSTVETADRVMLAYAEQTAIIATAANATDDMTMSTDQVNAAMKDLQLFISGPLGAEMDKHTAKQETLRLKMEEVEAQIIELNELEHLTAEQQKELDGLQTEYEDLSTKYDENATAHDEATKRIMFNILSQRAAMDGLTQQEFEQLNKIALQWGLVDQATFDYVQNVDRYWQLMASSATASMDIVQSEILELSRLQSMIEKDVTITYRIVVHGSPPRVPKGGDPIIVEPPGTGPNDPYVPLPTPPASGGYIPQAFGSESFTVPPGFPRDSFRVGLTSGERFSVQTQAQQNGAGDGGGTTIYNVYPQYSQYSNEQSLGRDIKSLEMLHNSR